MAVNEAFLQTFGGQLVVGLASGLLSPFLIWLFYRFANDTLVPWVQRRVYSGLSVAGNWRGERRDGDRIYGFDLDLLQQGHALSGTFAANNVSSDGTQTNKIYKLRGSVNNNYLLLAYGPSTPRQYGSGAFLFQMHDAGRTLRGGMLFMRTKSGTIMAVDDLELTRAAD